MSAYSLALDCKLEGRVRTSLAELVEYYRNEEDYEVFLLKQEKDKIKRGQKILYPMVL